MQSVAVFASGAGSNAENIIRHFKRHPKIRVVLVLSNKAAAAVLAKATALGVDTIVFNHADFYETTMVSDVLEKYQVSFIVLAGFLWLVPPALIEKYPRKIVNIHPALLPLYGGKGMYGDKVHQAVKDNLDSKTGITIHYVNEVYDSGDIIFQASCEIDPVNNSIMQIAARVHELEYRYYPEVIEKLLTTD